MLFGTLRFIGIIKKKKTNIYLLNYPYSSFFPIVRVFGKSDASETTIDPPDGKRFGSRTRSAPPATRLFSTDRSRPRRVFSNTPNVKRAIRARTVSCVVNLRRIYVFDAEKEAKRDFSSFSGAVRGDDGDDTCFQLRSLPPPAPNAGKRSRPSVTTSRLTGRRNGSAEAPRQR